MSCKKKNKVVHYGLLTLATLFLIGLFESVLSQKKNDENDGIGG